MVRDWLRRLLRREHGQAIIETAFILPIILVITLTLVDFARGIDQRDVLQHAVREGGRLAAVTATKESTSTHPICDEVHNQSQGLVSSSPCSSSGDNCSTPSATQPVCVCYVHVNANGTLGDVGDAVRVGAYYNFSLTAGSSELLHFFGLSSSTFSVDMTPSFDFALETAVTSPNAC